ncbi:phospholipase D-like domain-containing protein [Mesorhizobium sp. M0676]|uniref:phospholipase D-like domain-containing protein n=1 Tax=Mesorhizobium sp. M0676 TaxID=2956984 RepID=UPI003335DEB8
MSEENNASLRAFVNGVLRRDSMDIEAAKARLRPETVSEGVEAVAPPPRSESDMLEAVISLHRPVLAVVNDKVDPDATSNGIDTEEAELTKIVRGSTEALDRVIRSVGRIDLPGDGSYPWIGTGWIIDSELGNDIIVTNAHVAKHFAERSGEGFAFSRLPFKSTRETPYVDFRHEGADTPARSFGISDVIYIANDIDAAFLRVKRQGSADGLSQPISLLSGSPKSGTSVATLGYPGADPGVYDVAALLRIFGNVFNTKRLSPGRFIGTDGLGLMHDCSTMPGSSGSILVELSTGKALGLHYQGVPFKSNHAVPAAAIAKLIKDRPWAGGSEARKNTPKAGSGEGNPTMGNNNSDTKIQLAAGVIRIEIPLQITIRLGTPVIVSGGQASASGSVAGADQLALAASPAEAAKAVARQLADRADIVDVRYTYLYRDGLLTGDKGIVVRTMPDAPEDLSSLDLQAPANGVPLVVETADLASVARKLAPEAVEQPDSLEAAAKMAGYQRDLTLTKFALEPVKEHMQMTLHVSPEAGWRVLASFFRPNDYNRITVGMYNFTAPHIIGAVKMGLQRRGSRMTMTLDRLASDSIGGTGVKEHDVAEETTLDDFANLARNRFKWTPAALTGPNKLFFNAYHIKVAVLSQGDDDNKRFWLSSGNWASSNQAPFGDDRPIESLTWSDVQDYDRDWHAVVVNDTLATLFRNHLEQDYDDDVAAGREEAAGGQLPDLVVPDGYFVEAPRPKPRYTPFPPLKLDEEIEVTPILTPDNYPEIVTPLIKNAKSRVLFINQSFDIKEDESSIPAHYLGLLKALLNKQKEDGVDVRIIFRSGYGKERDIMRRAVEFGFDKDKIKFYGTCHTKGIVVDDQLVLLGSQNWTGAGTKFNRDASLLVRHKKANEYFAKLFQHDWDNLATNRVATIHPGGSVRLASGEEALVAADGRRVALSDILDP